MRGRVTMSPTCSHTNTHKPCTHSVHVPAQRVIYRVVVAAGITWRTQKDKASHAILGKAVQSESVAQRWLERGMRKLHWNPFNLRGCNFWKSHEERRRRFPSQSQPLSFIMWDSSMINLPSLYFWLSSKACSCTRKVWNNHYEVKWNRAQLRFVLCLAENNNNNNKKCLQHHHLSLKQFQGLYTYVKVIVLL